MVVVEVDVVVVRTVVVDVVDVVGVVVEVVVGIVVTVPEVVAVVTPGVRAQLSLVKELLVPSAVSLSPVQKCRVEPS